MDDVSWTALTLSLTVVGGLYTWFAYRRGGLGPALRGAAVTLLPLAALLTDTLRMFVRIGSAVADWATGLVFSPVVWIGVVLAGVAVVLFGASRVLDRRETPAVAGRGEKAVPAASRGSRPGASSGARTGRGAPDDEMAEIEAILRDRGIS